MTSISRRNAIKGLAAASTVLPNITSAIEPSSKPLGLSRINFGSCCHQDKPQPIWASILKQDPQLFLFLGDNIYADTHDMNVMRKKYARQTDNFSKIRNHCDVLAIWDDHDFGANDVGADYPQKKESRDLFLQFWGDAPNNSRNRSSDGIYHASCYGPLHRRVQIIMPDLRFHRQAAEKVDFWENASRLVRNMGPYAVLDEQRSQLSPQQWQWLEQQLLQPAKIRIIASSLQFLADYTGWEAWAQYPGDRKRMIDLIEKTGAEGVIFVSGDTHWGEISRQSENVPYPLYDMTSSGLTETWSQVSPNRYRMNDRFYAQENFGELHIDWHQKDPQISMGIRDINGQVRLSHHIHLSELSFQPGHTPQ